MGYMNRVRADVYFMGYAVPMAISNNTVCFLVYVDGDTEIKPRPSSSSWLYIAAGNLRVVT